MKPWCVVRVDQAHTFDFGVPDATGRRDRAAIAYAAPQVASDRPHDFSGVHQVYFADDEPQANVLAEYLAQRTPGNGWLVAKSASLFRTQPGPVTRGVYTEKGFFPAT